MKKRLVIIGLLFLVFLFAPAGVAARVWRGNAAWYGRHHQGRRMANGERFDPRRYTAASKTIPLGRKVKVTYLRTMRSVTVTITDRGPYGGRRIIDLSEAAAAAIGLKRYGVGRVEIRELPDRHRH